MSTSVLGPALLILLALLLGTALFGMLWAAVMGLVSLAQDLYLDVTRREKRLPRTRTSGALPTATSRETVLPTTLPRLSTDAMWHEMQGTSKRSRVGRRLGRRTGSGP